MEASIHYSVAPECANLPGTLVIVLMYAQCGTPSAIPFADWETHALVAG
jgi:hypothetical protein